ncbi:MAG: polyprenyl synthetase family protein [Tannerellaceae bacterium]|nr:polyprenyl synthetase family protein [Tannerellaceae bacterium]
MESKNIYNIPASAEQRTYLRQQIENYVKSEALIPPLSMEELSVYADTLIKEQALDPATKGWIMVEANNTLWKETVASIPYEKRILLLPQCLSNSDHCTAETDEIGLLCRQCMNCPVAGLEKKAEELGMMSIVAEGFTAVMGLIQNRVVDTIIGVGCLESLEKAFPLMVNQAIPDIAIPLNKAGCKDTTVDTGYVHQILSLHTDQKANLLDHDRLKSRIRDWFSPASLSEALSQGHDHTSTIARKWMGSDGKRWRPYLLAATYMALTGKQEIPEQVRKAAIAVECFHKASLVHDDIQDNDPFRYGKATVHSTYGIPIGINVGDILLGEGYRLLSLCENPALLQEASMAHIALCKGQGAELEWSLHPQPLSMETVLDIFRHKTVPAFEVSLVIGILCDREDPALQQTIHHYSEALGIAYQLQDDIEDFRTEEAVALRPSSVLAAICIQQLEDHLFLQELLSTTNLKAYLSQPAHLPLLEKALEQVETLADEYHTKAIQSLQTIRNIELKRLLFRVMKKILTKTQAADSRKTP